MPRQPGHHPTFPLGAAGPSSSGGHISEQRLGLWEVLLPPPLPSSPTESKPSRTLDTEAGPQHTN